MENLVKQRLIVQNRVVVTGVGLISPVGIGTEETWAAILRGQSGIGSITLFDAKDHACRIAGEVKGFRPEAFLDRKDIKKTSRFIQFAIAAAEMAVRHARLVTTDENPHRLGIRVGSGIGGFEAIEREHTRLMTVGPGRVSPFFITATIANLAAGQIAIRHGAQGTNHTCATACTTGAHDIGEAFRILQQGEADVMICGAAEAAVTPLTTTDLPSGTNQITGLYSGDNNYQSTAPSPLTVSVGKATGSDVLTSSTTALAAGQPVTLTDTLSTVNGVVPTGTVTFYNGSAALGTGTINASGVAALTTRSLPVGTDTVTSSYGGDSNYTATGSSAVTETVSKASASGTLTSSNTAPNFGQSITLTEMLPSTNGLVPTGTVTFYNGTTVIGIGTVNASGVATLTTGALPAGTDSVTVLYGGDANFSSTPSNSVVETVGKTTPTAVLTTSNNSPSLGQTVTLTDTLSVVNAAAPTGTVTFYNGTTVIGTGTVNSSGVATLSTNSLSLGTDTVTAVYAGDATYNTATSNAITETVTKASGTDTLSTSNAAPSLGQSVTFADILPNVNSIVPTGTVTFYNGANAIWHRHREQLGHRDPDHRFAPSRHLNHHCGLWRRYQLQLRHFQPGNGNGVQECKRGLTHQHSDDFCSRPARDLHGRPANRQWHCAYRHGDLL